MFVKIGEDIIWESKTKKLLGITIDKEVKFDKYINQVCILKQIRNLMFFLECEVSYTREKENNF